MIKRIVVTIAGLALVAAVRPAYLIGVASGFWQPLSRPVGVSANARYVDAFKSAAWFDCSVNRFKDVDVCRAWDSDGKLIAFGSYRLEGENRAATVAELRPFEVQPYPGHPNLAWIYLFGSHNAIMGKTLVPVNDAGQPLQRFEVRFGQTAK